MAAKTGRRIQISASFCMMQCPSTAPTATTVTGWPPTRLPGSTTTGSPAATPSRISTRSPARRPVRTRFSTALPSSTPITFSMPAKRDDGGGGHQHGRLGRLGHDLGPAKAPGRSRPSGFGTSASTMQRAVVLADRRADPRHASGVGRRDRPRPSAAPPGRSRTPAASRSGTARRRRSGWTRTSTTTGCAGGHVVADADAGARWIMPSNGAVSARVGELLAGDLQLGASAGRAGPGGRGRPRSPPGSAPRPPAKAASAASRSCRGMSCCSKRRAMRSRVSRAWLRFAAACLTTAVSSGGTDRNSACRARRPEAGPAPAPAAFWAWRDAELEIGGHEAGEDLAAPHRGRPGPRRSWSSRPATLRPSWASSSAARVPDTGTVRASVSLVGLGHPHLAHRQALGPRRAAAVLAGHRRRRAGPPPPPRGPPRHTRRGRAPRPVRHPLAPLSTHRRLSPRIVHSKREPIQDGPHCQKLRDRGVTTGLRYRACACFATASAAFRAASGSPR